MTGRKNNDQGRHPSSEYEVGYGKPPKSGQFEPGQSGNPKGRPIKAQHKTPQPPGLRPTAKAIREVGQRLIAVREGDSREYVPTTTAVMRALAVAAIKQGPLAMREFLKFSIEEEERFLREKRGIFDSWKTYKERAFDAIERAKKNGRTEPELLPHPGDVLLDYQSLEVSLVGPVDNEGAQACERLQCLSELLFQLMIYHGEENSYASNDPLAGRLGILGLHYWQVLACLPPRLRNHSEEFHQEVERRLCLRTSQWEALLKRESEDLGIPFIRRRGEVPVFALGELVEKLRPDERKNARRLMSCIPK